jgi:hypothetical protein
LVAYIQVRRYHRHHHLNLPNARITLKRPMIARLTQAKERATQLF